MAKSSLKRRSMKVHTAAAPNVDRNRQMTLREQRRQLERMRNRRRRSR